MVTSSNRYTSLESLVSGIFRKIYSSSSVRVFKKRGQGSADAVHSSVNGRGAKGVSQNKEKQGEQRSAKKASRVTKESTSQTGGSSSTKAKGKGCAAPCLNLLFSKQQLIDIISALGHTDELLTASASSASEYQTPNVNVQGTDDKFYALMAMLAECNFEKIADEDHDDFEQRERRIEKENRTPLTKFAQLSIASIVYFAFRAPKVALLTPNTLSRAAPVLAWTGRGLEVDGAFDMLVAVSPPKVVPVSSATSPHSS
ncbi:hypothetical protein SCHPADRAFT_888448 [Schizopora paradoxa]|uniref:Uncharacterized protein n=1 Tax=Schizopora paradoxa TaxID=27342 RepID=A0A0H2S1B1_9AGAM|nr:hypothetical protein SCHPADRAFT_888448 [Schizopora paradoxa]